MSQREPYVVLNRTGAGVTIGRNFATLKAARRHRRLVGYNTIAQKRKGHAGFTIIESLTAQDLYAGGRKRSR